MEDRERLSFRFCQWATVTLDRSGQDIEIPFLLFRWATRTELLFKSEGRMSGKARKKDE